MFNKNNLIIYVGVPQWDYLFRRYYPIINLEFEDFKKIPDIVKNDNRKKIVIIDVIFMSYMTLYEKEDLSWADLIIIQSTEYLFDHFSISDSFLFVKSLYNNSKCIFIYSGSKTEETKKYSKKIFSFPSDLVLTKKANKIPEYTEINKKKYLFDVLLGSKRDYRIDIFNFLEKENLLETSLVSIKDNNYIKSDTFKDYESEELKYFEVEENLKLKKDKMYSGWLSKNNVPVSCVISPKIYENSWFSIISETWFNSNINSINYISEKTAKCLLSNRIFICFAAPNHLKYVRDLGFKTFNNIIDESYDQESDDNKRFNMACEQIKWLSTQDPKKIYSIAKSNLIHNSNLMKNLKNHDYDLVDFLKINLNS